MTRRRTRMRSGAPASEKVPISVTNATMSKIISRRFKAIFTLVWLWNSPEPSGISSSLALAGLEYRRPLPTKDSALMETWTTDCAWCFPLWRIVPEIIYRLLIYSVSIGRLRCRWYLPVMLNPLWRRRVLQEGVWTDLEMRALLCSRRCHLEEIREKNNN